MVTEELEQSKKKVKVTCQRGETGRKTRYIRISSVFDRKGLCIQVLWNLEPTQYQYWKI